MLSGHSGGGSFIFGYLNAVNQIPDDVVRIAFLDSDYAYDRAAGHKDKLAKWLAASDHHYLCVLAYNDAVALLNGKHFVSAAGGTWGRSHAMERDLAEDFKFTSQTNAEFQRFTALDGRIQFILKENPEQKIYHTVQVERNGFIHCMVSGTPVRGQGLRVFRPARLLEVDPVTCRAKRMDCAELALLLTRIFIVSNTIWIREANSPSPYPLPKEREPPRQTIGQPKALGPFERCSPRLPLLGERVG